MLTIVKSFCSFIWKKLQATTLFGIFANVVPHLSPVSQNGQWWNGCVSKLVEEVKVSGE